MEMNNCPDCGEKLGTAMIYLDGFDGWFAQDYICNRCGCYLRIEGFHGILKLLKRVEYHFWVFDLTRWIELRKEKIAGYAIPESKVA